MRDTTIVKLFAIGCLTTVLIVNFLTMKIDSNITALAFTVVGGIATITAGTTRVTVSHGLATTPTKVLVTPIGNPNGRFWVENITDTSFDIVIATASSTGK